MTALLRTASNALKTALQGGVALWQADLFDFTLADGVTVYHWTSWDRDLVVSGVIYSSRKPWLSRSTWNVSNTMEVPSLTVRLDALNDSFAGGAQIKLQIHNGLFDGASFLLSRAYMTTPGSTAALGTVGLFGGVVAGIDLTGVEATITIKGKNNILDQMAPRNIFQISCVHAFCDPGCTLSRAAFTTSKAVGSSPTSSFLPWSGSPPANAALFQNGTIRMTTGSASGQSRTVVAADSTGLTLAYPLYNAPLAGDTFTAFQGCDKTFNSGSGQSCTDRSNTQNYRGFPYVPPPNSAY